MNITLSNIEKLGILREEALGRVYEGVLQEPHRKVLIKELILPPVLDKTCGVRIKQRFLKEAEILKNILNPSIAVPIAFGEEGDSTFVAYPLPQGIPLNSYIETKGAIPKEEALLLTKRIVHCYQMLLSHHIQRANIIPHDFFLQGNSSFHFLDTTLCPYDKTYGLYDIGFITGDRAFYAPEQIERGKISEQSLIFSIGLMLYWIMTGEFLYDGDAPFECFSQILTKPYSSLPERLNASVDLYDLMRHILQKDETKRFATLQILEQTIDQVLDRERVERALKEREERPEEKNESESLEKSPSAFGKFLRWAAPIILLLCIGFYLKNCFFTGYEKVHALSPESQDNLRTAWRRLANNELEEAGGLAADVLKKEKISPEASLILGEARARLGEYAQSLPYLEQGKKALDDRINIRSSLLLAQSNIRLERFLEAEVEMEGIARKIELMNEALRPEYKRIMTEFCFREGRFLFEKYRADSALPRRLQKIESLITRMNPTSAEIDFIKGLIGYLNEEDKASIAYLKQYQERAPGDPLVLEILRNLEEKQTSTTP